MPDDVGPQLEQPMDDEDEKEWDDGWGDEFYPDEEEESDYEDSISQRVDYLEEKIQALTDRVVELEFKFQMKEMGA